MPEMQNTQATKSSFETRSRWGRVSFLVNGTRGQIDSEWVSQIAANSRHQVIQS
jgi:hypothetical protein